MKRLALGVLAAVLIGTAPGCNKAAPDDPVLLAPTRLVASAQARNLVRPFINPGARAHITRIEPSWSAAVTTADITAAADPAEWRKMDRQVRFDAVLLAGAAAEFQPLLQHLLDSPDWRLEVVDNWGFLFVRNRAIKYSPPDPSATRSEYLEPVTRARYLAQMATNLYAARMPEAAARYLDAAIGLASGDTEVLARQAIIFLGERRWTAALDSAERALTTAPKDRFALAIKAQALAGARRIEAAWKTAEELARVASDPSSLFLHARLAHEVHAYGRERESLEKLIVTATQTGQPATLYRVLLGQCYAKQGLGRLALEQFEAVLADDRLTSKQRGEFQEIAQIIRTRAGLRKPDDRGD